ncbi:MAG: TraR/DksA family transcriptional regulator [Candidatus Pacebacteria bacterium]|nr:TraR/DksA family transcriptional regulator [Candidatus Paceibacterota bacterium]
MKKQVQQVSTKVLPQSPPATTNQGKPQTKTCYSDSELEEFRQIILLKIKIIDKDQKNLKQQIKESTNLESRDSTGIFNNGARAHEIDICTKMVSIKADLLGKLHSALGRIGNKTYGICRETGKLISTERLIAVPHATLCIEAKK